MPSSPTPRLRVETQAAGENLNTWGQPKLNNALTRLEEAIAARTPLSISGAYTLDSENYVTDEARNAFLDVTGGTGGTITIPAVEKIYLVRNNASGNVILTTGGGASATITPGEIKHVVSDATNVYLAVATDFGSNQLHNVTDPSSPQDVATKAYVDATAFSSGSGGLPGQAGNAGKFLGTNGSAPSWTSPLPVQTGNANDVLGTDGTNASWVTALLAANNLSDLTSPAGARTNLGLGALAVMGSVNNADWSGSALSIANGGTGSTTQGAAQTALGIGTAGLKNTGTSGSNVPLMSAANTWSAKQTFVASGSGAASINLPAGTAPTIPATGDIYFDGTNLFVRQSGAWSQLALASAAGVASFNTRTGSVVLSSGDVTTALGFTPVNAAGGEISGSLGIGTATPVKQLHIQHATSAEIELQNLSGTVNHRSWNLVSNGSGNSGFLIRQLNDAGTSVNITALSIDGTSGIVTAPNGFSGPLAGTATSLLNPRAFSITGAVTASGVNFDGTGNVALATTLAASAVANSNLANMTQATVKGRASGAGTGAPTDLTVAQISAIIDLVSVSCSDKTIAATGHINLGGLIINWGTSGSIAPTAQVGVTFNKTFPNACFVCLATAMAAGASSVPTEVYVAVDAIGTNGATISAQRIAGSGTDTCVAMYIAIGN